MPVSTKAFILNILSLYSKSPAVSSVVLSHDYILPLPLIILKFLNTH